MHAGCDLEWADKAGREAGQRKLLRPFSWSEPFTIHHTASSQGAKQILNKLKARPAAAQLPRRSISRLCVQSMTSGPVRAPLTLRSMLSRMMQMPWLREHRAVITRLECTISGNEQGCGGIQLVETGTGDRRPSLLGRGSQPSVLQRAASACKWRKARGSGHRR